MGDPSVVNQRLNMVMVVTIINSNAITEVRVKRTGTPELTNHLKLAFQVLEIVGAWVLLLVLGVLMEPKLVNGLSRTLNTLSSVDACQGNAGVHQEK